MKSVLLAVLVFLGLNFATSADAQTNPNTLWGYFQTTAGLQGDNEAFDIPVARLLGKKVVNQRTTLVGEYNFVTGKPQIFDVNYVVTKGLKVDAGILLTLTTYDHPGPWNVFFPSTPLLALNPQFVDEGAMIGYTRGNFSAHLAAYNGEGVLNKNIDGDVDLAGRIAFNLASNLTCSLVGQVEPRGRRNYEAIFIGATQGPLQLNFALARREFDNAALHFNAIVKLNSVWSVGAQFEEVNASNRFGALFSIQRQLGWRSRLEFNHHVVEGRAPQLEVRFQQAIDFLK